MEKWIQWKPAEKLDEKYYIEKIVDNNNILIVLLCSVEYEQKKVRLSFPSTHAYQCIDESFRLHTIRELDKRYPKEFYANWTFFKIIESSYIQWFLKESHKMSNSCLYTHFAILTDDIFVDVISTEMPVIECISYNNYK